ncbi:MAG: hypothetical protein ABEJ40_09300 [Haloarculaceae archaeon]
MSERTNANGITRRKLLRGSGAALAAGAATSAGCVGTLPLMGQRVRYGRVETPARGDPDYRQWIPAPGELTGVDEPDDPGIDHLTYVEPGNTGVDAVGYEFDVTQSVQLSYLDYVGVDYEDFDWVVTVNGGAVLAGDVDVDAVAAAVEGVYEADGSHAGYDLYARADEHRRATIAVSEDAVVFAARPSEIDDDAAPSDPPAHRENAMAFVDADRGEVDRHHEVDPDFERATEAVGSAPSVWFGPGLPVQQEDPFDADPLSSALSYTFDDGAGYFVYDLVFPEGRAPSKSTVRSLVDNEERALASAATEVTVDGRVVTVEIRLPEARLDQFGSDGRSKPPYVTWTATHDAEARTVTITHRGGESFDAGTVTARYGTRGEKADAQFADSYDTAAGSSASR